MIFGISVIEEVSKCTVLWRERNAILMGLLTFETASEPLTFWKILIGLYLSVGGVQVFKNLPHSPQRICFFAIAVENIRTVVSRTNENSESWTWLASKSRYGHIRCDILSQWPLQQPLVMDAWEPRADVPHGRLFIHHNVTIDEQNEWECLHEFHFSE